MASSSGSYLERKLKNLNCMKSNRSYGSVDSIDSVVPPAKKTKRTDKKHFSLFSRLGRSNSKVNQSKADQFSVSYEHITEENDEASEQTRLLSESLPVGGKKRYASIFSQGPKKGSKKNVKFNLESSTDSNASSTDSKTPKKKKSFLKRTGKMIVRTCRLMSYGTPYAMHLSAEYPYNTRYPPDYRYYDFETKQWDYGYSNNYMGTSGLSPSVFF